MKATEKQMRYIDGLCVRAGYRYASHAIKEFLGKNPVGGLNRTDASRLIDWLRAKIEKGEGGKER